MKKIISLVLVLTICLSTLTYASPEREETKSKWFEQQLENMGINSKNLIRKTNEGWIVGEEDGVVIIPFDNANPNVQNGRSMPSVVGGPGNDPLLELLFGLGRTMQNQDKPIIDLNLPAEWWEHEIEFE